VWKWSVECGVWSVECEVWSVECGVWSVECGVWRVECGGWSDRGGAMRGVDRSQHRHVVPYLSVCVRESVIWYSGSTCMCVCVCVCV